MDSVHSYEQRSSSRIGQELDDVKENRIIIVNRHDPSVDWSVTSQPIKSKQADWFGLRRRWCRQALDENRKASSLIYSNNFDYGPFPSNELLTSKYTIFNFLPKNLFEQFRRLANFYFLITAILQVVLPFSPVGPTTSLLPLFFVVSTTAIKQAYEDYLRHKLDKQVNNRMCHVLRDKSLIKVRSKDLRVGDFVYVKNNEEIPCDMILLASANGHGDRCYVTTANLDGETNLKSRTCVHIKEQIGEIERLDDSLLVVECDRPNSTLYEFNGYIRSPKSSQTYERLVSNLNLDSSKQSRSKLHEREVSKSRSIVQTILRRIKLQRNNISTSAQNIKREKLIKEQTEEILSNISDYHEIPLDTSNLLLRASRLRNTSFIYGLAIYTGSDTKLARNSHVKPNKFSSTESKVNLFLCIAFMLLILFSLIGALRYRRLNYWFFTDLIRQDSPEQIFVAHFLLYNYLVPISLYVTLEFIKFLGTRSVVEDKKMKTAVWMSVTNGNTIESTSLKYCPTDYNNQPASKSLETIQSFSSSRKVKIIEKPKCNSSDLNEELGQVEVLFSDKTGTLTENKMLFTACSTYGNLYRSLSEQLFQEPNDPYNNKARDITLKLAKVKSNRHAHINTSPSNRQVQKQQSVATKKSEAKVNLPNAKKKSVSSKQRADFVSSPTEPVFNHRIVPPSNRLKLIDDIENHEQIAEFFICLCLCSTITLNETVDLDECMPERSLTNYDFQTASPDEESLISAAHQYGITMCKSNDRECYILIKRSNPQGKKSPSAKQQSGIFRAIVETEKSTEKYIVRHFEKLVLFEFSSARKRMSVVYKDCDNNCFLMVSKGSEELLDCVDLEHLEPQDRSTINASLFHFEAFAKSGLRALLVGRRVLSTEEYSRLTYEMKEARLSINNRENLLNSLYRKYEINLKLIGATAVEDTLQEGVPETIFNLREAGIKVWLLTGDKVETAISVAYLCKLLDRDMTLFQMVRLQDVKACHKLLNSFLRQLREEKGDSSLTLKSEKILADDQANEGSPVQKYALIADGRSLYFAMKYARKELAKVSKKCVCVLGCRLSPLQKAEVVEMIKNDKGKPITAAIGDGANDVSMIQEAHVGVGVRGKEGRQAVNCSDFAINRFYMLNRLFFVHGHLFYHRSATTIHYFFYKNIFFVLPQFLYSFYNLSSAQNLYHPLLLITYNLVFTSLPIILYGLYEQHIPEAILENHPRLYRIIRGNSLMRMSIFFSWLLLGVIQALIGFYVLYFTWGSHAAFLESGKMGDQNAFGIMLYFVIILTVTMRLYFISKYHSICFNFSTILSCLLMPILFYFYSLVDFHNIMDDNSLYGQFEVYLKSPMFWLAIFATTSATMIPDILWYLWDRIVYFRMINSILNSEQQSK